MKRIFEFFQDSNDQYSSKRLFALASFGVAIGLAFSGRDSTTVSIFMGAATAVFLGQAISKT
jgi:hypothetical protein